MELEATIQELLARRAQRRLEVFRSDTSHWKNPKQYRFSTSHFDLSTSLEDAKAVTSERGFLREQLHMTSLTALKRWHVQLQLLELDDHDASHANTPNDDLGAGDDPQSPLGRALAVVQRDRACFDISFVASPTRVADLKESLFDSSDDARRVCEALAFSSTRRGSTMRVVLFRLENSSGLLRARSSLFVPDLQQRLDALVEVESDARLLLDVLWPNALVEP